MGVTDLASRRRRLLQLGMGGTVPVRDGLARGWKVSGGTYAGASPLPEKMTCDVAIVGSGAGAGITAELLSLAGLDVLLIEEGPLKTSSDFHQLESEAYSSLYPESAARKTADKAINILQGRCVGGSTTVNWTSSFRTPDDTLAYWREHFGLADYLPEALSPWFAQGERRLNIGPWLAPPNENNDLLQRGARKLRIAAAGIRCNVKDCWNVGCCGLGCPTNAKQSMLVTTIPAALDRGARLLVETRAQRFEFQGAVVAGLEGVPVRPDGSRSSGQQVRVVAKHYLVAGGAINSPALLLRSNVSDPRGRLGSRTFLHPVRDLGRGLWPEGRGLVGGAANDLQRSLLGHGPDRRTNRLQARSAAHAPGHLCLDTGRLRPGAGAPTRGVREHAQLARLVARRLSPAVARRAGPLARGWITAARLSADGGALEVVPVHEHVHAYRSWANAKWAIGALPMKPHLTRVVSAHVMGGCGMGGNERLGVVGPDGQHWQLENLSVHHGSLFPTGIGANPQLSIYGIVNRLASRLAQRLSGRAAQLA